MKRLGMVHNCKTSLPPPGRDHLDTVWKCDCGQRWYCAKRMQPHNPFRKRTRRNADLFDQWEERVAAWERGDMSDWWPYSGPVDEA